MSFTVEDGTGVTGANSYMTAAEFKAYHKDRGVDTTAIGGNSAIEKLLIRGTDYIEMQWGMKFKGSKEFEGQPLSFPRTSLYNRDGELVSGIPDKLKWALAEYALKLNSEDLFPDLASTTNRQTMSRVKVGPIEEETRLVPTGDPSKKFPAADRWLQEYVFPGGRAERA